MKKIGASLFIIFLMCLNACQYVNPYIDMAEEKGISNAYLMQLQKWTRSQIVYSQFETRVHISATYKSPSFNKAYLDEYSRIYEPSPEQKQLKESAQSVLDAEFTEFFVYAYIPDMDSNDIDKPTSIWSVYLVDGKGQRINPIDIRRFKKITPVMEVFYPYLNPYYGVSYSIKFPPLTEADANGPMHFKLNFQSVLGKVELNW